MANTNSDDLSRVEIGKLAVVVPVSPPWAWTTAWKDNNHFKEHYPEPPKDFLLSQYALAISKGSVVMVIELWTCVTSRFVENWDHIDSNSMSWINPVEKENSRMCMVISENGDFLWVEEKDLVSVHSEEDEQKLDER